MLSRHRKTREWQKQCNAMIDRLIATDEKLKGETVGAVHPSEIQPVSPYHRAQGVTLGIILQGK
jgi:hypothetical protein